MTYECQGCGNVFGAEGHTCRVIDQNQPLISDAEIEEAFRNTNFGHTKYRKLLSASVFKKAVGYHCGYTITTIMKELKLIGANEQITKRGKLLLRETYSDLMRVTG